MKPHIPLAILTVFLNSCQVNTRIEEISSSADSRSVLEIGSPITGTLNRAGAAQTEFIPDAPTSLAGFGGVARRFLPPIFLPGGEVAFCRPYQRVSQAPKIKTAVLEVKTDNSSSTEKIFIVSLDIVAVTADLTKKIHSAIDEITGQRVANLNSTLVLASHTHSGPSGLTENPLWSAFVCDQYSPRLANSYLTAFKKTLRNALERMQTLDALSTRTANIENLLASRFEGMRSENQASLLTLETAQGKSPLSLLRMAVHPTTFGPSDLVLSADLVAPIERAMQEKFNTEQVILMQTEIGNMKASLGDKNLDTWANEIATHLEKTQDFKKSQNLFFSSTANTIPTSLVSLNGKGCGAEAAKKMVSLDVLENLPAQAAVTAWKLNSEISLFLPGEWTTSGADQLRLGLKNRLNGEQTVRIHSLAHDYTGYHLSRSDYNKQALESCSSLYGENGTERLLQGLSVAPLPL